MEFKVRCALVSNQKVNPRVTRISYIDRVRKCYIMFKKEAIGELWHEFSSLSGEFDWVIRPYWEVIDRIGWEAEIPGIDDTLRKEEYIRRYNPLLVTQRVIPQGREDLPRFMQKIQLDEYDLFEILCRGHGVCGNNDLYISRTPDELVDMNQRIKPVSIPDFDTSEYGWLNGYINKVDQEY